MPGRALTSSDQYLQFQLMDNKTEGRMLGRKMVTQGMQLEKTAASMVSKSIDTYNKKVNDPF
mgnify:CR=1 FL=1